MDVLKTVGNITFELNITMDLSYMLVKGICAIIVIRKRDRLETWAVYLRRVG